VIITLGLGYISRCITR